MLKRYPSAASFAAPGLERAASSVQVPSQRLTEPDVVATTDTRVIRTDNIRFSLQTPALRLALVPSSLLRKKIAPNPHTLRERPHELYRTRDEDAEERMKKDIHNVVASALLIASAGTPLRPLHAARSVVRASAQLREGIEEAESGK